MEEKRTLPQNSALHLYYTLLANEFNENGLDVMHTLRQDIEVPWTPILVKELIWKKIQKVMLNKKSTTELSKTEDIDKIYDTINRWTSIKFGISIPFPSEEELNNKSTN
jgi:hypothetical protein